MRDDIPIEITEAAGDWFDLLSLDGVTLEERKQFADWLRRSPVHVAEFLQVSALHTKLSGSLSDFPLGIEELLALENSTVSQVPGLSEAPLQLNRERVIDRSLSRRKSNYSFKFAVAAMLLLSIFIGFWAVQFEDSSVLKTEIGEQRTVILDDGSRLEMNTNTEVKVRFRESVRELQLVRGELLIDVKKDSERPFVVSTDMVAIQVTGTQFNVYRRKKSTEISVVEGRVLIDWSSVVLKSPALSSDQNRSLELSAGQKTVVGENVPLPKAAFADIHQATAWTERRLSFDNEEVATVVDEFNRYNRRQISIGGSTLAKRRISGVFDINDPEAFFALLGALDAIEVQVTPNGNQNLRYKENK